MSKILNLKFLPYLIGFVIVFSVQYKMISNTLPYTMHVDEAPIVSRSINTMQTGDFNPHFFNYPTLPIYISTIGTTLGFFKSASKLETKNLKSLSGNTYPYYQQPTVIKYAKLLFIIMSSFIVIFLMMLLKKVYNLTNWIYLVPLIAFVSPVYVQQSWAYLNPNIVGAFFIIAGVLYMVSNKESDSYWTKVVIPAIFIGAAIASKYNFAILVIPAWLSIILYSKKDQWKKAMLILPISILIFVLFVPYSLLDFPKFLTDVAFELHHYKAGHSGYNGTPGLSQFWFYIQSIANQFTIPLTIIGILGMIVSYKAKPKEFVVIISFPIALLLFMSMQKVHFLRNMISLYAIYSIFIVIGIAFIVDKIKNISNKNIKYITLFLLLIILFFPVKKVYENLSALRDLDSRKEAINWINNNVKKGSTIYVSKDLYYDIRSMQSKYKTSIYSRDDNIHLNKNDYIIIPNYGYDHRKKSGKQIAEKYNHNFQTMHLDCLKEFGKSQVLVNYPRTVPSGNPSFKICVNRNIPDILNIDLQDLKMSKPYKGNPLAMVWSGSVTTPLYKLVKGSFNLMVNAKGSKAFDEFAKMKIQIIQTKANTNSVVFETTVETKLKFSDYIVPFELKENADIFFVVSFINDKGRANPKEDRNLYLKSIRLKSNK